MSEELAAVEVKAAPEVDEFETAFLEGATATPQTQETGDELDLGGSGEEQVQSEQAQEAQPEQKYVQITEQDYQRLMTSADAVDQVRQMQDKAFGKIGSVEQVIRQLQTQTAAGVEVSEEDVADLAAEYPEIGAGMLKVLQKVAGKLKGTGGAAIDQAQVSELVQQQVGQVIEQVKIQAKREAAEMILDDKHPDWRTIPATPEYEAWFKAQTPEYQSELYYSIDPNVISKGLSAFKQAQADAKAAQQHQSTRQNRMQAAVAPKSAGGLPTANDDDDDFQKGWNEA